MKYYCLDPQKHEDKEEWDRAWDLAVPGKDKSEYNPDCWESWQYMGSDIRNGGWTHTFRHRCHPKTNKREYRGIAATENFSQARDNDDPEEQE